MGIELKKIFTVLLMVVWFLWPALSTAAYIIATRPQLTLMYEGGWKVSPYELWHYEDLMMTGATLLNCVWLLPAFYFCPFKVFKP